VQLTAVTVVRKSCRSLQMGTMSIAPTVNTLHNNMRFQLVLSRPFGLYSDMLLSRAATGTLVPGGYQGIKLPG